MDDLCGVSNDNSVTAEDGCTEQEEEMEGIHQSRAYCHLYMARMSFIYGKESTWRDGWKFRGITIVMFSERWD